MESLSLIGESRPTPKRITVSSNKTRSMWQRRVHAIAIDIHA